MNRYKASLLLGAVALLAGSTNVAAQARPYIFAGGGASIALGSYKDYAKTGWVAQAGIGADVGTKGVFIEAEAWLGSNKHSDVIGDKTNLLGGMGAVGYSFGAKGAKAHPYIIGSLGFMQHKFVPKVGATEKETKLAYSGGAGLSFDISSQAHFWVEGRYLAIASTGDAKIIPLTAGFSIYFKK